MEDTNLPEGWMREIIIHILEDQTIPEGWKGEIIMIEEDLGAEDQGRDQEEVQGATGQDQVPEGWKSLLIAWLMQ